MKDAEHNEWKSNSDDIKIERKTVELCPISRSFLWMIHSIPLFISYTVSHIRNSFKNLMGFSTQILKQATSLYTHVYIYIYIYSIIWITINKCTYGIRLIGTLHLTNKIFYTNSIVHFCFLIRSYHKMLYLIFAFKLNKQILYKHYLCDKVLCLSIRWFHQYPWI